MSEKLLKLVDEINEQIKNTNKFIIEILAIFKANRIVDALLKEEEGVESTLHVDTKVYDDLEIKETTSLFTWYKLKSGGKIRKCSNAPCPHFLKFNEDTRKYQHGKYDAAKEEWYHVADNCEFWGG